MAAGLKAKSLRGERVSEAPGRGSGGQKQQSGEPGCFSESLGILPLPARDLWTRFHQLPSENKPGTVQRVCLSARWGNMASLHQQVAYFPALGFILCGHPPSTFRKKRTVRGPTTPCCMYILTEQQSAHAEIGCQTCGLELRIEPFWYQPKCVCSTKYRKS